jgi:peptide/nickel transport system substrate-binding protein
LLKGLATVGFGDQAPGTPWINPNIQPRPYDLDKAAALLAEAGFTKNADGNLEKDGKPLVIEHWIPSGDEQTKRVQQVIAASWRKLGIQVDEREEDIKSIWGPNGYQFTQAMTAGQYSWTNGNDPDDMFYWHSSQIPSEPTGTGGNTVAFFQKFSFQEEIDDLTLRAAAETDLEKRKQLYWQIQELLHEEVPVIFMYWGKRIYVAPKALAGFKANSYNYLLWDAQDWSITN